MEFASGNDRRVHLLIGGWFVTSIMVANAVCILHDPQVLGIGAQVLL